MWRGRFISTAVLAQAIGTWAATVTYDWEVTWVHAAPDGFSRPIIGINGHWPCPRIEANVGDTVVVNLKNNLGNETTGLHFHGIDQINSNFYDGASMVNSCPVIPGSSTSYTFLANAPGTYWYHSHNMGQYPDGLRGALIIRDPQDPYAGDYDEEVILEVSDWYHNQTISMVQAMLSPNNTQWRPPIPDSMIVNEGGNPNIAFDVGKTYRVRLINYAALTAFMLQFSKHTMQVIMTDGSYVQQQATDQIRIAPAQRYDVLITASGGNKGRNFPYLFSMDLNRDFTESAVWDFNTTGYLITDADLPYTGEVIVDSWQPFFEGYFSPLDNQAAFGPVTKTWQLDFGLCLDTSGIPRMCFNNQTYITQKTPTLYTAATVGDDNTEPDVYGAVLPFIVEYGDVVDLIVNNLDPAIHPFHLHGHQFQIVDHPLSGAGVFSGGQGKKYPPRRDVIAINGDSHARLRFVANNPGIFLFHCHIEWHVEMGLTATLIEAPEKLRDYPIPQDMIDSCQEQGIPTEGNAAGNIDDPLDFSGFNIVPSSQYYGALWPYPGGPNSRRVKRNPYEEYQEKYEWPGSYHMVTDEQLEWFVCFHLVVY